MQHSHFPTIKLFIKTALPWYIVFAVALFTFFLPAIFGIDSYEGVGVILDRNFGFLSIFVFSNIHYIEIQQKTADVFYLMPDKQKKTELYRRLIIRVIFILLSLSLSYYVFSLRELRLPIDKVKAHVIAQAFFASFSSILFFGGLSCLAVTVFRNLWIGCGFGIIIWLLLSSVWANSIPDFINVFIYGEADRNWIQGKIFGLVMGIVFFLISIKFCKLSPHRYRE